MTPAVKVSRADVGIRRLANGGSLPLPQYQSALAAGADLYAAIGEDEVLSIAAGGRALVPTGVAIALPPGFEAQVRPRSGLAVKHGISVLNSPGTIDADYRGEIKVALINLGDSAFAVKHGDRIAQLVVSPVTQARWVETETLADTDRGTGGFGSTGAG